MGINISKLDGAYFPRIPILQNVFKHTSNCQINRKLDSYPMPASIATPTCKTSKQRERPGRHVSKASIELRGRKPFSKTAFQDLGDPRSPCINLDRTPLIFDESVDETLNFDDTFSDLFVEKQTKSNIMPIIAPALDHEDQNAMNYIAPTDDSENDDISAVVAAARLQQSNLDPRSPSIGVARTPICFNDEEVANTTNKSTKRAFYQSKVKRYSSRTAYDHLRLSAILRSKQTRILKRKAKFNLHGGKAFHQKIGSNNENAGVYMSGRDDMHLDKKLPSKYKRTPLSCVRNGAPQIEEIAESV